MNKGGHDTQIVYEVLIHRRLDQIKPTSSHTYRAGQVQRGSGILPGMLTLKVHLFQSVGVNLDRVSFISRFQMIIHFRFPSYYQPNFVAPPAIDTPKLMETG